MNNIQKTLQILKETQSYISLISNKNISSLMNETINNFNIINSVAETFQSVKPLNDTIKVLNKTIKKEPENYNKILKQVEFTKIITETILREENFIKSIAETIPNSNINSTQNKIYNIKTISESIPLYISYSKREDRDIPPTEAFEKSSLNNIMELSKRIKDTMKSINITYNKLHQKDLFKCDQNYAEMLYYIKGILDSEEKISGLTTHLYKVIYEGSNIENNKIYNMKSINTKYLDMIKWMRQYFHHKDGKNNTKVEDYIKQSINVHYPSKPSEWLKFQEQIYKDLLKFLEDILDYLND